MRLRTVTILFPLVLLCLIACTAGAPSPQASQDLEPLTQVLVIQSQHLPNPGCTFVNRRPISILRTLKAGKTSDRAFYPHKYGICRNSQCHCKIAPTNSNPSANLPHTFASAAASWRTNGSRTGCWFQFPAAGGMAAVHTLRLRDLFYTPMGK